ncbi:hypothetical protein I552_5266 [Mycobacterium xenopi 3993]|nr:hypothetical protein I552_5266 [Mycobacterium xenopi 3993]
MQVTAGQEEGAHPRVGRDRTGDDTRDGWLARISRTLEVTVGLAGGPQADSSNARLTGTTPSPPWPASVYIMPEASPTTRTRHQHRGMECCPRPPRFEHTGGLTSVLN